MELCWSVRSAGLTAQLQALRKALYHKYLQEVAALKEQHSKELRRLREEREQERRLREQDLNGISGAGSSTESLGVARQVSVEEKQHWERVEEEVARVCGHVRSRKQQFYSTRTRSIYFVLELCYSKFILRLWTCAV